jgi:hypothetical protein
MTGGVISAFRDAGLFWQPPSAVAKVIVGIEADTSIVGKAFYIEGDGAWEFENSFYDAQPQWLGEFLHVLHPSSIEWLRLHGLFDLTIFDRRGADEKNASECGSCTEGGYLSMVATHRDSDRLAIYREP